MTRSCLTAVVVVTARQTTLLLVESRNIRNDINEFLGNVV